MKLESTLFGMTAQPKESVRCPPCFGSGILRKRDMIGVVSIGASCKRCHGSGRIMAERGSALWRIGRRIAFAGDSPGISKFNKNKDLRSK